MEGYSAVKPNRRILQNLPDWVDKRKKKTKKTIFTYENLRLTFSPWTTQSLKKTYIACQFAMWWIEKSWAFRFQALMDNRTCSVTFCSYHGRRVKRNCRSYHKVNRSNMMKSAAHDGESTALYMSLLFLLISDLHNSWIVFWDLTWTMESCILSSIEKKIIR